MCRPIEPTAGGFPMMNAMPMYQGAPMGKQYPMNPLMMGYQKPQYEVYPNYGYTPPPQVMPFFPQQEVQPVNQPIQQTYVPRDAGVDVGTFQDLLDVTLDEDEGEAVFDVNEGFDNSEMSILMSFLTDHETSDSSIPETKVENVNDSVLTLNLLDDGPLEALLSSSMDEDDEDCLSDVQLTPPSGYVSTVQPTVETTPEDKDGVTKNRRLCKMEGCHKRSRSHGLCIAHGGGRRCAVEGCNKSSQGGNLCIKHGGGKRCEVQGCERAAQSNMLCKAHGGGPRCLFEGCDRSSQGGGYCRSHGGGKRCLFEGCDKGTQRGDFCALHGGSRLCGVAGCMRNDRGGGFCATHGGGKRCSEPGCTKPCRRQGLCSAHFRLHAE